MSSKTLTLAGISCLRSRVKKLESSAHPKWGKMNVTEMLNHCNTVNELMMAGSLSTRKSSLKQRAIRFFFLVLPRPLPKNIKAPKAVKTLTSENVSKSFDDARDLYLKLLDKLTRHSFPAKMYHPAFGNLSPSQWGKAAWKHMDHHLRQFGV